MLIKKKDANPNYLMTIVRIDNIIPIKNSNNLIKTTINGYDIICSKDIQKGDIMVYFPCECCINPKYLSANNLYDYSNYRLNSNKDLVNESNKRELCGFFGKNGRVRIIKLRGEYSQGFIAPIQTLINTWPELKDTYWNSLVGAHVSHINDEWICKKYVCNPINQPVKNFNKAQKYIKKYPEILGDFKFHYDTKQLGEYINEISPEDRITISIKVHGTSVILSNMLCQKPLGFFGKFFKSLGFKKIGQKYMNIYSSRKVIKNFNNSSYYGTDIWGCVNRDFGQYIEPDMTVYGEIVGYEEGTNKFIQKNYDYGCKEGTWKFMPYRIVKNCSTRPIEYNVNEVWKWSCDVNNLEGHNKILPIKVLYRGLAKDLYKIPIDDHWRENFIERLKNDPTFGLEYEEPMCINKVPREGIVIRIDGDIKPEAWKLKAKSFYAREAKQHDNNEVDIEEIN